MSDKSNLCLSIFADGTQSITDTQFTQALIALVEQMEETFTFDAHTPDLNEK